MQVGVTEPMKKQAKENRRNAKEKGTEKENERIESIASARETVKKPLGLEIESNGTHKLSELAIDGAIRVHLKPCGAQ